MKKESRILLAKAIDSLIFSIEIFNRPHNQGRTSGSLIFLDHSFEMLLKAGILDRNGAIREKREDKNTIGFDACVRKALSDGEIAFIDEKQALTLQSINGQRDAAQHHILEISEQQLYIHMQSGFTLFADILKNVFKINIKDKLPERVLPVATLMPSDIATLFRFELREIRKLLEPGKRKQVEAFSRIRPLAILDATVKGEKNTQPSEIEIKKIAVAIKSGISWDKVFTGVAGIEMDKTGSGPTIELRIAKKADVEITVVEEGTEGAFPVAIKRVNELGYYQFGAQQIVDKINSKYPNIKMPQFLAIIKHLKLIENHDYFKSIKIGTQVHKRYSYKTVEHLFKQIPLLNVADNWRKWRDS